MEGIFLFYQIFRLFIIISQKNAYHMVIPKSLAWKHTRERIYASNRGYLVAHDPPVSEFQDQQHGIAKLQLLAHIIEAALSDGKITSADLFVSHGATSSSGSWNNNLNSWEGGTHFSYYIASFTIQKLTIAESGEYFLQEDALIAVALKAFETIQIWGPALLSINPETVLLYVPIRL